MPTDNVIKSVETSIDIVDALTEKSPARVGEVAEMTGNSTANVSKHLNTLRKHGFVIRDDDGYRLSFRYLDIGGMLRESFTGAQIIKPKIVELAEKTGEAASFLIEENGSAVVLYREVGHQGVAARSRIGKRLPLHQIAGGKAIMAHMPSERVTQIIDQKGLEAATENTITDESAFREALENVRERGYAINDAESTQGLDAIAAPIRTVSDDIVGACAVSGPTHRLRDDDLRSEITEVLLSFTNEIELNLTYS